MPDVEANGGIVEIPLAQTGEGIADCELIRWFVKEVTKQLDPQITCIVLSLDRSFLSWCS